MIGCIIQARLDSSRLPGKILMKVDEKNTILDYVINQLRSSKYIDKIIVATTTSENDNQLIEYANNNQLDSFRGSENDVLDRYYKCAKHFSLSTIIRVTSDCPLIDPTIIDELIENFQKDNFDYATNKLPLESSKCPHGAEVEICSFNTLEKTWKVVKKPSEREHVTPYIYNNPDKFTIFSMINDKDLSYMRYTVDRQKDLEIVQEIIKRITTRPILTKDIVKVFEKEPDLLRINSEYERNEGYHKSLRDEKSSN